MPAIKKIVLSLFLAISLLAQFSLLPIPVEAESGLWTSQIGVGDTTEVKNVFGGQTNPQLIVAKAIKALLSFLGIIFLALIIWGGWKYMLARGNDDEVAEALKIIKNSVIGLFIVMAAWLIADYTTDCVLDITQGSSVWMCK